MLFVVNPKRVFLTGGQESRCSKERLPKAARRVNAVNQLQDSHEVEGHGSLTAAQRHRGESERKCCHAENLKLLCVPRGSVRGKCGGEQAPTERRPPKVVWEPIRLVKFRLLSVGLANGGGGACRE